MLHYRHRETQLYEFANRGEIIMKVVVAIDSLKNSLTSVEAGRAIEAGVRKAYGGHPVQVIVKPLADGGEGMNIIE